MTYNDKAATALVNFFSVNCAAVAHPSGVSQRRGNTPCDPAAPIPPARLCVPCVPSGNYPRSSRVAGDFFQ